MDIFGDSHIKLIKQHKEYKIIFERIFEILKQEKPDIIYHGGDLFHSKLNLSPEAVQMASWFLKSLADIAPTYIIAGNHDLNLSNSERLDAITPIIDTLKHPNLLYLKEPQEIILKNNYVLNALVITGSPETWKKISDPNKINIACYHRFCFSVLKQTVVLFLNMVTIQKKYLMVLTMVY